MRDTHRFSFAEELVFLLFGIASRRLSVERIIERAKQFLLLTRQLLRNLYNKGHIVIAPLIIPMQHRNTFAAKANLRVGLCAGLQIIENIAVDCMNANVSAERCLSVRNRHRGIQIVAIPLEHGVPCNHNIHKQASALTAVCARFAEVAHTNALSLIDTCRYHDLDGLARRNKSRAVAILAFVADYFARALTIRADFLILYHAENRLLGKDDGTASFTFVVAA